MADNDIQWQPAFRMYRGLFLFVLEFFLFGINLYGWQAVGINNARICDFKNLLCPLRVLEVSAFSHLGKILPMFLHLSLSFIPVNSFRVTFSERKSVRLGNVTEMN